MQTKSRHTVALVIESSRAYGRCILRGIARYSRICGDWSLLHEEMTMGTSVPEWVSQSNASGVIARIDEHNLGVLRQLQIPIVDVLCSRANTGLPQVETDDRMVARMAFDHLWERGFRRFAFCGYRGAHYSENRLRHFLACADEAGSPVSVYESEGHRTAPLAANEHAGVLDVSSLTQWLTDLDCPTGVFVCHDARGQQVLNACRHLGIAVPDDLGVIGVDDDDTICSLSDPPLTSVRPDAEQVGYIAAETLDRIIRGGTIDSRTVYVHPQGVVQRLSTRVQAVEDRELARVCRYIREHACDGADVADVVRFSSLSRRQLERRFRGELQRTPYEEIVAVRVRKMQQLLEESDMPLEQIAPLTGYANKERLSAVFKREVGQSPGVYRQERRTE